MKKITLLAFLLSVFSSISLAQTEADYSGNWVFHRIISKPDEQALKASSTIMQITQSKDELNVLTKPENRQQTNTVFSFGKEITSELESSNGKILLKLKAEFNKKGNLILFSVQTLNSSNGKITIRINETFSMSKDKETLTIIREVLNSQGLPITEFFVARREANSNNDSKTFVHSAIDLEGQFPEGIFNVKAKKLINPGFPAAAKANRVTGAVPIRAIIDEKGEVIFAQAIFGHPLLKPAAIESAIKSQFEPVTIEGKPIKVAGIILFNFKP